VQEEPSVSDATSGHRLGVLAGSRKENERRLALHPRHLERVDADLRRRIVLECGYGDRFGVPDSELAPLVAGMLPREQVVEQSDIVLLPKPVADDLRRFRDQQVLWGWPHCVQDEQLTQLAIDKRLTVVAFEAMNHWTDLGAFSLHVFHANNELAGYCSVLHALSLVGSTGHYGRRLSAAVIGFGATARGAVTALKSSGVHDIDVLTQRDPAAVAAPLHYVQLVQFEVDPDHPRASSALIPGGRQPLAGFLAEHDIVVNCVLQDTDAPLVFVTDDELKAFAPGSLIVDVSCDEGMGFSWARPTSFTEPIFTVGQNIDYYAVDHSPSYLWNSATWEISEALMPYLRPMLSGPDGWKSEQVLDRAVEIRDGVVQNPSILSFQHRSADYPHLRA
jgi:alanine dehydrogenase